MMRFWKILGMAVFTSVLFATISGCQKPEGAAEHAGKEVDKAVEDVGQKIEKIGNDIQDAAKGDNK